MPNSMKYLTVITVTYNAEKTLEKTILSVIGQTAFAQMDYILVDGGSSDRTLDIAHRYKANFATIISERDHGIFDAMNKGAKLAQTPWIVFMNAGDQFYDSCTVASLRLATSQPDHVIYGDCIRVYNDGQTEYRKARPFFEVDSGIPGIGICHQSIYLPTSWILSHPYRWQQFPHCADFEQIYAFWQERRRLQYVDRPLCLYAYGDGFSSQASHFSQVFEENALITHQRHSLQYYKQKLRMMLSHCKFC